MQSPHHPIAAQIVVTPRCNLAWAYCAEFDHTSAPVPTPVLQHRIDRLAELGTSIITLSGGEPLLHPDADAIIARIRAHGAIATLITNGFLLTRERIRRLNRAGLDYLQISIDNLAPDAISKKNLTLLDRRLADLAALAEFQVTINSVVGASAVRAQDAYDIAPRAKPCAPFCTVSCVHQVAMLDDIRERPKDVLAALLEERKRWDPGFKVPGLVRLLSWIFLDARRGERSARLALRMLGAKDGTRDPHTFRPRTSGRTRGDRSCVPSICPR